MGKLFFFLAEWESSFMWLKFHFQMLQRPISQIPIFPTPRVWLVSPTHDSL